MEALSRLAARPGIQSTLVLSRSDGSIIKATGILAPGSSHPDDMTRAEDSDVDHQRTGATGEVLDASLGDSTDNALLVTDKLAKAVFAFVRGAEELGASVDHDDDVKLLRMRTRRHEVVIVPGKSFRWDHTRTRPQVLLTRVSKT